MPLTTFSTIQSVDSLGKLVSAFYSYSLEIAGLCVFLMFVYAGFSYMFNERLPGGPAKGIIQNAITGIVLLYSAYIILSAINCDLVGTSSCVPGGSLSTPSRLTP